jgi:hypothetical protein
MPDQVLTHCGPYWTLLVPFATSAPHTFAATCPVARHGPLRPITSHLVTVAFEASSAKLSSRSDSMVSSPKMPQNGPGA